MALKLNPYVLPTGSDFLRGSKIAKQNEGPFGFGSGWAGEIVGRTTAAALDVFGSTATGLGFNLVWREIPHFYKWWDESPLLLLTKQEM